ncbi:MAG: CHAT domain-containing protein [Coleofasciculus sp. G3-WIS-01]|uniref:CHAT domain-containing protein n=1 Tax=Coleofasciculus sp. G3-WIS-01 TaxID=3069528 RepID=UPI0032FD9CF1
MDQSQSITAEGRDVTISGASVTVGTIDTSSNLDAGAINLTATADQISTQTLFSLASEGQGGDIRLQAQGDMITGGIDSGSTNGDGGSVTLTSITGNIFIDPMRGELTLETGSGSLAVDAGVFTFAGGMGRGGDIIMSARGNINTGSLGSGSAMGDGGNIRLTSATGIIDTFGGEVRFLGETIVNPGVLLSGSAGTGKGGDIILKAGQDIITGHLISSSLNSDAGKVELTVTENESDIEVSIINSQALDIGAGGDVEATATGIFTATDVTEDALSKIPEGGLEPEEIPDTLDREASISTSGGSGGGSITIIHQGGLRDIPFTVGDGGENGTAGSLSSGEFTIEPVQSFSTTYIEGNIQIINLGDVNPVDLTQPLRLPERLMVSNPTTEPRGLGELDQSMSQDYADYFGLDNTSEITLSQAQSLLQDINSVTGIKPAVIYVLFVPQVITPIPPNQGSENTSLSLLRSQTPQDSDRLELILVTADQPPIRKSLNVTRSQVLSVVRDFHSTVTNARRPTAYRIPAQQVYQWLVGPLETELQQLNIENLSFILDAGLRHIPLAALHDGNDKAFIRVNLSYSLL